MNDLEPNDRAPKAAAAAIVDDGSCDADVLLASLACARRRAGRRVRGLLMTRPHEPGDRCSPMVLVDIHTLDEYLVSQATGTGSTACRADPQGFARASQVLWRALDEAPQLVVSNRFGGLEAEGRGFRAELLEILLRGLPLLTVVSARHVDAWDRFTGGATLLPPSFDAASRWLDGVLGESVGDAARAPAPADADAT